MPKKSINAKEILADIKAGIDDTALMEKYGLTEKGLQSLFKKLIDAGVLKQEELENRASEPEKAIEYLWKCPACGKPQMKEVDACPDCGVIVDKFREAPAKRELDRTQYVWTCSDCGTVQSKSFDQCPKCRAIESGVKTAEASEQAEEIRGSEIQEVPRKSDGRTIQDFVGTVLGSLSKHHFYVIGSIGAFLILSLVIVSFTGVIRTVGPAQVLPADVKLSLVASLVADHVSKLSNVKVIQAEKGIATAGIKDQLNPREIYCVRLYGLSERRKLPCIFNVILYRRQSGDLTTTVIDDKEYYQGFNSCPQNWDNVCPFGCRDTEQVVTGLRKRVDELVKAAWDGDLEMVQLLLDKGVDVNVKDKYNDTAMMAAAKAGNPELMRLLKDRGAEVILTLTNAAYLGDLERVQHLIKEGADVNARDENGVTAMMAAAKGGHSAVVKFLLGNRADVNAKDYGDGTALSSASCMGHLEVVRLLLDKGADVNAKDDYDRTALWWASINGHLNVVRLLVDNGADVNVKDKLGGTALEHASADGHTNIVDLLKRYGAKAD